MKNLLSIVPDAQGVINTNTAPTAVQYPSWLSFSSTPSMASSVAAAALPPLVLPPWLIETGRYNIKLPHIDTLLSIADKGRRPRCNSLPIGPEPSGLYKTAQDTVARNVPKLAIPAQYVLPPFPLRSAGLGFPWLIQFSVALLILFSFDFSPKLDG